MCLVPDQAYNFIYTQYPLVWHGETARLLFTPTNFTYMLDRIGTYSRYSHILRGATVIATAATPSLAPTHARLLQRPPRGSAGSSAADSSTDSAARSERPAASLRGTSQRSLAYRHRQEGFGLKPPYIVLVTNLHLSDTIQQAPQANFGMAAPHKCLRWASPLSFGSLSLASLFSTPFIEPVPRAVPRG